MMDTESEAILYALSLILQFPHFVAGEKQTAFLSYIVNMTLQGNGRRLKAYTIALEALGKPESFDPQNNPSVRVMASRIRAALTKYNAKPNAASIKIELKAGSYIPIFTAKEPENS